MSFNLEAHLEDHAFLFNKIGEISKDSIHFNFSFLDLQFLDRDVKETMSKLLDTLLKPTSYNVANGKRKDKHGNIVQKFTTRKVDLQKDVQAYAIHLEGPEGEDTMPHIHFIANGSARFGNGYSLLKKHISVISEQFGLLPNFDEIAEHNPLSVKSLSRAVSQITWSWKKSTNIQLKNEIHSRGLTKSISLLESYSLKTKNLTYYVKSMEGLKTRLNRMQLDVDYKGHHLRNTYPIPLTQEDMEVIKLLQSKTFTQKAIKPYLKNPIFRDFIRHSANTTKPYIYDALKEQTSLLDNVYKNTLAVKNYQKLMLNITPLRKSQLTPSDNQRLLHKNELRRIIIEASKSATDEKIFRSLMKTAGYSNFELKKKQGKVIGCIYTELTSKRSVPFTDLGLHWAELKKSFMLNSRKIENNEMLPSPTLVKSKPTKKEAITAQKRTKTPDMLTISYNDETIAIKKQKAKEKSQARRTYEKLIPKIKAEIIKFESFITRVKQGISDFKERIFRLRERISRTTNIRTNIDRAKSTESIQSKDIRNLTNKISKDSEVQSNLTFRCNTAGEVEYQNESISEKLKKEIAREEDIQSKFENGDYEFSLHKSITGEIAREESSYKELRTEISSIEKKLALKNTPTDNTPSPFGMRM